MVGDHGESLGEHGELTHGFFVYQADAARPLHPGRGRACPRESDGRASPARADLAADAARRGSASPRRRVSTASTCCAKRPRRASPTPRRCIRPAFGWAPLRSFRSRSAEARSTRRAPELYDLAADPAEARDLAPERADDVERLRQALAGAPRARACALDGGPRCRDARSDCARSATWRPPPRSTGSRRPSPARSEGSLESYRAFEEARLGRGPRRRGVARSTGLRRARGRASPDNVVVPALARGALRARRAASWRPSRPLGLPGHERARTPVAWHERAVALARPADASEAEESERTAVALEPVARRSRTTTSARSCGAPGPSREARAQFETATPARSQRRRGLEQPRERAARALGRRDEAAPGLRHAARARTARSRPAERPGHARRGGRPPQEGADLFRRALELAPGMEEARLNLAVALSQAGLVHEALAELDLECSTADAGAGGQRARDSALRTRPRARELQRVESHPIRRSTTAALRLDRATCSPVCSGRTTPCVSACASFTKHVQRLGATFVTRRTTNEERVPFLGADGHRRAPGGKPRIRAGHDRRDRGQGLRRAGPPPARRQRDRYADRPPASPARPSPTRTASSDCPGCSSGPTPSRSSWPASRPARAP